MIKLQEAAPVSFTVPLAPPEVHETPKADLHPAVQGLAIAGLSAIVAVSPGRLPEISPFLLNEDKQGVLTIINPDFVNALELEGNEQKVAVAGVQVLGIAGAVSRLLKDPRANTLESLVSGNTIDHDADLHIHQVTEQDEVGVQFGRGLDKKLMVSRLAVQTRHVVHSNTSALTNWLRMVAVTGPESSTFLNVSVAALRGVVGVSVSTGTQSGLFPNPYEILQNFDPLEDFALAIDAAVEDPPSTP